MVTDAWPFGSGRRFRRLVGDGDRGWVWGGGDRNNPPANAVDQLQPQIRPRLSRHYNNNKIPIF